MRVSLGMCWLWGLWDTLGIYCWYLDTMLSPNKFPVNVYMEGHGKTKLKAWRDGKARTKETDAGFGQP